MDSLKELVRGEVCGCAHMFNFVAYTAKISVYPNVYGTGSAKVWKTRHTVFVDIRIFLYMQRYTHAIIPHLLHMYVTD